eukprot:PhM_4_TR6117/c0_g1_i1/m.41757
MSSSTTFFIEDVLVHVLSFLSLSKSITCRSVCRQWEASISQRGVDGLSGDLCRGFGVYYPTTSTSPAIARHLQAIVRCEMLPRAFVPSSFCPCATILQEIKMGKYSRWLLADENVARRRAGAPLTAWDLAPGHCFGWIRTLAWAVRFIGTSCASSSAYRPSTGFKPYDPEASMSPCGDGWDLGSGSLEQYTSHDPLMTLGLFFLSNVRPRMGPALEPHDLFVELTSLEDIEAFRSYPHAIDLAKHARLCAFLLRHQDDSLLGLLWDCDAIISRSALSVVGLHCPGSVAEPKNVNVKCRQSLLSFQAGSNGLHPLQIPAMFNIICLCEFVERMSK